MKRAAKFGFFFVVVEGEGGLCGEEEDVEAGFDFCEGEANDLLIVATDAIAVNGLLADFGADHDSETGDVESVFDDFDPAGIVKSTGLGLEDLGNVEIFAEAMGFVEHKEIIAKSGPSEPDLVFVAF